MSAAARWSAPAPGKADLYFAIDATGERWTGALSDEEKARAAAFRFEADRRSWAAARGLLRALLGRLLALEPSRVAFRYGPHGRPELADAPELRFNLSHSGGAVLVGVCRAAIGVDLERPRPIQDAPRIVESYFSARERDYYARQPVERREGEFYSLWTRKEAYLKALGCGLTEPLDRVSLAGDDAPAGWSVRALEIDGFTAALAVEGELSRWSLRRLEDLTGTRPEPAREGR